MTNDNISPAFENSHVKARIGVAITSIIFGATGSCMLLVSPVIPLGILLGIPISIIGFLIGCVSIFIPKQHKILSLVGILISGIPLFLFLAIIAWLVLSIQ